MDQSPEYADQGNLTSAVPEQASSSVRGWQSLAERRGQELAAARAELAAYRADEKARQLAAEFPDAAELALRDGADLTAMNEAELAATQRGIEAARESSGSFILPNNPRKAAGPRPEPSIRDLEREAGDALAAHLASRF